MGQNSSKNKYGTIQIIPNQKKIISGQNISGEVILNLKEQIQCNFIQICFRGKEAVKLCHTYDKDHKILQKNQNKSKSPKNNFFEQIVTKQVKGNHVYVQEYDCIKLIDKNQNLYKSNRSFFTIGKHQFQFQFETPNNLLNSFSYKFNQGYEICYGKVIYEIAAGFQINEDEGLFDRIPITVIAKFPFNIKPKPLQKTYEDNFQFNVTIDKDKGFIDDQIQSKIICDNKNGVHSINDFKWKLVQYTEIKARQQKLKNNNRLTMVKEHCFCVPVGEVQQKKLSCIINNGKEKDFKHNVTINGTIIKNVFKLEFISMVRRLVILNKEHKLDFVIQVYEQQQKPNSFTEINIYPEYQEKQNNPQIQQQKQQRLVPNNQQQQRQVPNNQQQKQRLIPNNQQQQQIYQNNIFSFNQQPQQIQNIQFQQQQQQYQQNQQQNLQFQYPKNYQIDVPLIMDVPLRNPNPRFLRLNSFQNFQQPQARQINFQTFDSNNYNPQKDIPLEQYNSQQIFPQKNISVESSKAIDNVLNKNRQRLSEKFIGQISQEKQSQNSLQQLANQIPSLENKNFYNFKKKDKKLYKK